MNGLIFYQFARVNEGKARVSYVFAQPMRGQITRTRKVPSRNVNQPYVMMEGTVAKEVPKNEDSFICLI